jgi:hypothetical protein
MATYSFDNLRKTFSKEFTGNGHVDKLLNAGLDAAEFVGRNADTFLLGACCLLLGDVVEATEQLEMIETVELLNDHPELF